MSWRDRLAMLFGAATSASLLAFPEEATASPSSQLSATDAKRPMHDLPVFSDPRARAKALQLARHSSHSSHSSHASHASGSGGGYHSSHFSGSTVAPLSPPPPPPPPPAPRLLSPAPQTQSDGTGQVTKRPLSQNDISDFVQRVQIGLLMKGYDPGPATGQLNDQTKSALRQFQKANGLAESGTLDQPTLGKLGLTP